MFLVSSSRCGIAAKQLERELGCSYKTAWRMLNRIRNALMEQDGSPLSGEVEADETWIVFGAVERKGRIRAEVLPNSRGYQLQAKIGEFVLPGSMIYTDDWSGYDRLGRGPYHHQRINHSQRIYVSGDIHTNTIEGFFGHFKTDVRGTHHSISRRWLPSYLNEWVWKWNHRDDDEAMFRQLVASAAAS